MSVRVAELRSNYVKEELITAFSRVPNVHIKFIII